MIHCVKKAFPTLLILYELVMFSNVAESLKAEVLTTTSQLTSTINPNMTSTSATLETKQPKPTISPGGHDSKIKLGAANITRHHSFDYLNRSKQQFHLSSPRFKGPFFEEGSEESNVTARVGSTINLDCRIGLLGDKTVTWAQKRHRNINLLTVGRSSHSKDERIQLAFKYPNNYRLQISYVTKRDDGVYECQVATHPPKVKRVFLKITAPEVKIVDESKREVHERYYREGSSLFLTCLATSIGLSKKQEADANIISWKHEFKLLSAGSMLNITKESDSAVSILTITPLERSHSGNYTCSVGKLAEATVAVHVLNGELPAAVHATGVNFKSSSKSLLLASVIWSLLR